MGKRKCVSNRNRGYLGYMELKENATPEQAPQKDPELWLTRSAALL